MHSRSVRQAGVVLHAAHKQRSASQCQLSAASLHAGQRSMLDWVWVRAAAAGQDKSGPQAHTLTAFSIAEQPLHVCP